MSDLSQVWRAEMMSLEDIAAMFQCEREYARDKLTKRPGFPEPAPGSTRKFQRWRKVDVLRFVEGDE